MGEHEKLEKKAKDLVEIIDTEKDKTTISGLKETLQNTLNGLKKQQVFQKVTETERTVAVNANGRVVVLNGKQSEETCARLMTARDRAEKAIERYYTEQKKKYKKRQEREQKKLYELNKHCKGCKHNNYNDLPGCDMARMLARYNINKGMTRKNAVNKVILACEKGEWGIWNKKQGGER